MSRDIHGLIPFYSELQNTYPEQNSKKQQQILMNSIELERNQSTNQMQNNPLRISNNASNSQFHEQIWPAVSQSTIQSSSSANQHRKNKQEICFDAAHQYSQKSEIQSRRRQEQFSLRQNQNSVAFANLKSSQDIITDIKESETFSSNSIGLNKRQIRRNSNQSNQRLYQNAPQKTQPLRQQKKSYHTQQQYSSKQPLSNFLELSQKNSQNQKKTTIQQNFSVSQHELLFDQQAVIAEVDSEFLKKQIQHNCIQEYGYQPLRKQGHQNKLKHVQLIDDNNAMLSEMHHIESLTVNKKNVKYNHAQYNYGLNQPQTINKSVQEVQKIQSNCSQQNSKKNSTIQTISQGQNETSIQNTTEILNKKNQFESQNQNVQNSQESLYDSATSPLRNGIKQPLQTNKTSKTLKRQNIQQFEQKSKFQVEGKQTIPCKAQQINQATQLLNHEPCFNCLTNPACTEWHLLANGLPISLGPGGIGFKAVARYTCNDQEKPIMQEDLIDLLLEREQELSCSQNEADVIPLNRPAHACSNQNSSNQSNGTYKRSGKIKDAQSNYENGLDLNKIVPQYNQITFNEQQEETKQSKDNQSTKDPLQQSLQLPINNSDTQTQSRILEIIKHQRTQLMICVEFDLSQTNVSKKTFPINDSAINYEGSISSDRVVDNEQSELKFLNRDQDHVNELREVNQQFVDSQNYFMLNATCHGQRLFKKDLNYTVHGKKVIKSLQERLLAIKDYLYQAMLKENPNMKDKANAARKDSSKQGFSEQKFVLQQIRGLNKKGRGPFLRRPDFLHAKLLNFQRSMGFQIQMDTLPNIDSMMTNFNQIVLRNGMINKYFFCFDLPIAQMQADAQPLVSNCLVTRVPKGGPSSRGATSHNLQKSGAPWNLLEEFQRKRDVNSTQSNTTWQGNTNNTNTYVMSNETSSTKTVGCDQAIEQHNNQQVHVLQTNENYSSSCYNVPLDPNQMTNLDLLIQKFQTPMDQFERLSVFGTKVALTCESTQKQEVHFYVPSLSSLYLSLDDTFLDYHETEPVYNRMPIHTKINQLLKQLKHKHLVSQKDFISSAKETSYIGVLWQCQRCSGGRTGNQQSSFLSVTKLNGQLIGIAGQNLQRESFWTSPSHQMTFNALQGQLFDEICDEKIIEMQDLREKMLQFLSHQQCSSYDFQQIHREEVMAPCNGPLNGVNNTNNTCDDSLQPFDMLSLQLNSFL